MEKKGYRLAFIVAAALTVVGVLLLLSRPGAVLEKHGSASVKALSPTEGDDKVSSSVAPAAERSTLADQLNSPGTDVHSDLRLVNEIFVAYRGAVKDGDPVGENAEITAVLTGHNKVGFAFIPPDCPAINPKGELCDRWHHPYFFHQLSGDKMEIRSAGPDGAMWTADDEVLTP